MSEFETSPLRELIRQLVRYLGLLEKNEAACCQLSLTQCHALIEIGRAENLSLNDLSSLLMLDKSTMSRTVNQLVEDGLIERSPQSDRRYVSLELTETGRKAYAQTEATMLAYYGRVMDSIPEDKRRQVVESLELLIQSLAGSKCCL